MGFAGIDFSGSFTFPQITATNIAKECGMYESGSFPWCLHHQSDRLFPLLCYALFSLLVGKKASFRDRLLKGLNSGS
jgi:hypothetical protein